MRNQFADEFFHARFQAVRRRRAAKAPSIRSRGGQVAKNPSSVTISAGTQASARSTVNSGCRARKARTRASFSSGSIVQVL